MKSIITRFKKQREAMKQQARRMTMYDVAIIGGGPAAIFAADEFVIK